MYSKVEEVSKKPIATKSKPLTEKFEDQNLFFEKGKNEALKYHYKPNYSLNTTL